MEPRAIEPQDIRAGDRVRGEMDGCAMEGSVCQVGDMYIYLGESGPVLGGTRDDWSWTLLDRPEPPREVGSRWRDPQTGAEYVKTDHDAVAYVAYTKLETVGDWRLYPNQYHDDATIIARLVPLDGDE